MSLAILESLRGNNVASMPWQLAAWAVVSGRGILAPVLC
jgi:hypothetical protein